LLMRRKTPPSDQRGTGRGVPDINTSASAEEFRAVTCYQTSAAENLLAVKVLADRPPHHSLPREQSASLRRPGSVLDGTLIEPTLKARLPRGPFPRWT